MLNDEDVKKLAELARLSVEEEEISSLKSEIGSVLGYVSELKDVSGDREEKKAGEVRNVFRNDENPHLSGEFSEDILNSAPDRQNDYIKVKKIL